MSYSSLQLLTTEAMHIGSTASRHVPFAGAFAVAQRQSELKISEANAGAKLAKCTLSAILLRRALAAGRSVVIQSSFI